MDADSAVDIIRAACGRRLPLRVSAMMTQDVPEEAPRTKLIRPFNPQVKPLTELSHEPSLRKRDYY
jgi:hypothetical protein